MTSSETARSPSMAGSSGAFRNRPLADFRATEFWIVNARGEPFCVVVPSSVLKGQAERLRFLLRFRATYLRLIRYQAAGDRVVPLLVTSEAAGRDRRGDGSASEILG